MGARTHFGVTKHYIDAVPGPPDTASHLDFGRGLQPETAPQVGRRFSEPPPTARPWPC
jgi:hypothetical protein